LKDFWVSFILCLIWILGVISPQEGEQMKIKKKVRHLQCGNRQHVLHIACLTRCGFCFKRCFKYKRRRVAIKVLILAIVVVLLTYCGGGSRAQQHQPTTEPVESTSKAEAETETKSLEPQHQEKDQVEKAEKVEPEETKSEAEPESAKPVDKEVIPVIKIEPVKEPGKDKALDTPEIRNITDSISSGIIDIFKGFGYSGDMQVPDNFKRRVAFYIRYFSRDIKGSRFYLRTMSRGSQYLPMIQRIFKEKHLPLSLAYLPLIESGFKPHARSRAGAVGMWQFMKGTARMYGLTVTRWSDERKDPVKSTYAAAEYLDDLLAMFGVEDPFLGICAFNAGEGKILNALRKISYTERSFWTLVKKDLLRYETEEYIPRFLAIILIARDPVRYAAASDSVSLEPDEDEDQEILSSFHRTEITESTESSIDKPGEEVKPKKEEVKQPVRKEPRVSMYKVKRGDTLYSISRRYNVDVKTLKKWNGLRDNRIYPGQKLNIYPSTAKAGKSISLSSKKEYKLIYTVNYTDSLIRIALFFEGVTARDIMKWNRLRRTRIHPKQKLVLYLKAPPRNVLTHVVRRGETASAIARKYKVRMEYVLSLNGLVTNSRLKPGMRLKIYYF
jgi:membrane-bound lytic murein transglycosylase D